MDSLPLIPNTVNDGTYLEKWDREIETTDTVCYDRIILESEITSVNPYLYVW